MYDQLPSTTDRTRQPRDARAHLRSVIEEFGGDDLRGAEVVIDLTGDELVVVLPDSRPALPPPERPAPPAADPSWVAAPVLNRARYRRVGIDGVSTRPGELHELATLVEPTADPRNEPGGDPYVLQLVLAAKRRHPATTSEPGQLLS